MYLADRLGKAGPGPRAQPATGKTQLAKSVAEMTGARLIRLQCYEGLDESKALYEWNYKKQLLRIQAQRVGENDGSEGWSGIEEDIFSEPFLLTRPLLEAIRATEPVVLLIDEVDRVEVETEALLLEILSDYQVSIPELGTVSATQIPLVFLTSNNTRELSEALKRRCLFLHIDYPDIEREREIVVTRVPGITADLADQVVRIVRSIRSLELKKVALGVPRPSTGPAPCCCWAFPTWTPKRPPPRFTSCSSTKATSRRRPRSWPTRPPRVGSCHRPAVASRYDRCGPP